MTSSNNKFSLLASLTSLPGDAPASDDDDVLPSLAVEPVPEESPVDAGNTDTHNNGAGAPANGASGFNSELFQSAAETSASKMNMGSSALLSNSGLINPESSTGGLSGGGDGLFDQIDQEEEAARIEEERIRFEEQERVRLQEMLRKDKEAADQAKIMLLREEHERMEAEKQAQAQAQAEEQMRQQQQQQQASYMNSGSVMGTMQDLNLNDEPVGGPVYSNVQNQYSNIQNSQNIQPVQNQYSNVNATNNKQYNNPNVPTPNQIPNQVQGQNGDPYSSMHGVNPTQNGNGNGNGNAYPNNMQQSSQSMQQSQQYPSPSQPSQRQTTQEAGYGGASYVYSTTGNVQQQVYQHPSGNGAGVAVATAAGAAVAASGSVHSPALSSNGMGQSTGSTYQQPLPQQHPHSHPTQSPQMQQPALQSPPNGMSMPPAAPMDASTASYSVRSQIRQQAGSVHPMPNQHGVPQPGAQSYANGGFPMNGNGIGAGVTNVRPYVPIYNPDNFEPQFGPIGVTDPILVQSPGMFAGPPHWTYSVVVRDVKKIEGQEQFSAVVSNVRRRFRHFVALEERLRMECKGAILPPRPDKHNTRVIDEASTRQSAQFAVQRANELSTYLNALRLHPVAGASSCLKLFLTLPDHLGIAWPEVSSSIVTRLSKAGASTAVKVAEGTSAVIAELNSENQIMSGEDSSELLALASSEGLRISGVLQSVPKIENAIVLVAEHSQRFNGCGMEIQKLVNNVLAHEKQYSAPFEVLASGLVRCGRRTSRLAVELGAAAQAFTLQHKLCRYERLAFSDRRSALIRRRDARKEADKNAQKLVMNQHSLQSMGMFGKLDGYGREAALSDGVAVDAVKDADEIGHILQCEVARITRLRQSNWTVSLKIMAANMREAHAERAAIWEGCRNAFMVDPSTESEQWTNGDQANMQSQHVDETGAESVNWTNGEQPLPSAAGMQHTMQAPGDHLQQQVVNTN